MPDRLPDFIFPGFPRTGSQFIQRNLQRHPEIAYVFKPRFFNLDEAYAQGPAHYRRLLEARAEKADAGLLFGEGDEHYLSGEGRFASPSVIAERMHAVLPGARILICIRNQYDFLLSGFRYWKRCGISAPFDDFMAGWPEGGIPFAEIADFHPILQEYVTLFGRDRVGVFLHEDLADDETAFLASIMRFLDVSTDCVGELLAEATPYKYINPAPSRRLGRIFDAANALRMRNPQVWRWVFPVRLYRSLTALEYRLFGPSAEGYRATLTEAENEAIRQRYAPGNRELAQLLGIDLAGRGYPV